MATKIGESEFAVLAKQTGIPFSDAGIAELYGAYGLLERMLDTVRRPMPPELEPATVFRAGDAA